MYKMLKYSISILLLLSSTFLMSQRAEIVFQTGHQGIASSVSISFDSEYMLSIDGDSKAILWQLKDNRQLRKFDNIAACSFMPDGRSLLVVKSDCSVFVMDLMGKVLQKYPRIKLPTIGYEAKLYPDTKQLHYENSIIDLNTGEIVEYAQYHDYIKLSTFCPLTQTLVTTDLTEFHFYKHPNKTKTTIFDKERSGGTKSVSFSKNGSILLAAAWSTLYMFDGKGTSLIRKIDLPSSQRCDNATITPDGKHVIVWTDKKMFKLNAETGVKEWEIDFNKLMFVKLLAFDEQRGEFYVRDYKKIARYSLATGEQLSTLSSKSELSVWELKSYNDGRSLGTNQTGDRIATWDLSTGAMSISAPMDKLANWSFAIPNKLKTFLHAFKGKAIGNDLETGSVAFEIDVIDESSKQTIEAIGLSKDDKLMYCLGGNYGDVSHNLSVWQLKDKKRLYQLPCFPGVAARANLTNTVAVFSDSERNFILLYNIENGQLLARKPTKPNKDAERYSNFQFSSNDNYLAFSSDLGTTIMNLKTHIQIDIKTTQYAKVIFSKDEKYLIVLDHKKGILFYDIAAKRFDENLSISEITGYYSGAVLSQTGRFLFASNGENEIKVFDLADRKTAATLYSFKDGNWAVVSPDGRFDGTEEAQKSIYFVSGLNVVPLASLFEKFYTPHLLNRILEGEKFEPIPVRIDEIKEIPKVKILIGNNQRNLVVEDNIPSYTVENEQIELKVQADCPNDLVTEIQLFQNGKLVGSTRNLVVEDDSPKGEKSMMKSFNLVLNNGENRFRAIGLNSQRTESEPDEVIVIFKSKTAQPATGSVTNGIQLHLLVIGINTYKNSKYNLNYAAADASSFKEAIEKGGTGIFSKINVVAIGDAQATKGGITAELEKIKTNANAQDVFMFYYAGHGVMNNKKDFYLVPHDVTQLYGQDEALAQKGFSTNELQQFSKDIKAQKQLFVLDACQSAAAIDQIVAARGAAEEKAIAQLARATGTHWLTASGSEQFASEFAQLGHGAFTYVLLEALKGGADKGGDKRITVKELDAYLQEQVPEVTAKYKGTPQYPASYGFGNDFPIIMVK